MTISTVSVLSRRRCLAALMSSLLIAGCSVTTSAEGDIYSKSDIWSGRLSLRTLGDAPDNWVVSFVLRGTAERGHLTLLSPLGSTLARAHWTPGLAELEQGGSTRAYANLQELTTAISGSPLPVAAMFSWLKGESLSADGWTPQLDGLDSGRLQARRTWPAPAAEIRVILDPPAD